MPPCDRWYHQSVAHWHYKMWRCFWGSGNSPVDARRYWSYDRSFMTTTSRTIFSNRCWSRDHAYDQSYDDLPPGRKTDRSMRSLLAIVANIADRSHVRQITTDRTIKQSYDPVWQWLKIMLNLGMLTYYTLCQSFVFYYLVCFLYCLHK